MPTLASKLKGMKPKKDLPPLWSGPCGEGRNGGVSQSMLGRYLSCPERFRIGTVLGLKPVESFNPAIEYGNMWHAAEEAHARGSGLSWSNSLMDYCRGLCKKFPTQQQQVNDWYEKCKAQFPIYVEHWSKHSDVVKRTPLLEEKFDVPYTLPSGRVVRLRGKWDSVDLVEDAWVWLQENKTKSSIDVVKLERQLRFDLQTMLYLIALLDEGFQHSGMPIKGVRYNVIRRSAHKSTKSMLEKIEDDRKAGRIEEWFARWNSSVSKQDIETFKTQCLDPVLENLCDDYEWWEFCLGAKPRNGVYDHVARSMAFPTHKARHFRLPYGIYSPVHEGGFGDVDAFIENGSTVGLHRAETLFPELED